MPQASIVVVDTQRPRSSIGGGGEDTQWDDGLPNMHAADQESSGLDDGFGEDIYALPKVSDDSDDSTRQEDSRRSCASAGRRSTDGGRIGFNARMTSTPPIGYVCRRCRVPGHFIQRCPTNGNPKYDQITKAIAIGNAAKAAAAAAASEEEEIEGVPYARPLDNNILPPELNCPVCKQGMKDAVFATRCCFRSYCSECIREHRGTKSACVCGSTAMLVDDLVPNMTVRETISRILASSSSSATGSGKSASLGRVEDDELSKAPAAIDAIKARAEDMEVDHRAGERTTTVVVVGNHEEVSSVFKKYPCGEMEVEKKQGKVTKQVQKKRKQSYADADVAVNRIPYPYFVPGCAAAATSNKDSKAWTAGFRSKQMKMSTY